MENDAIEKTKHLKKLKNIYDFVDNKVQAKNYYQINN